MKRFLRIAISLIVITAALFLSGAVYVVPEVKQVVITQFGKPVGDPVTKPV